jgi:hypothetical protein
MRHETPLLRSIAQSSELALDRIVQRNHRLSASAGPDPQGSRPVGRRKRSRSARFEIK